jgi:hypothetical protein
VGRESRPEVPCAVPGCSRLIHRREYCVRHYRERALPKCSVRGGAGSLFGLPARPLVLEEFQQRLRCVPLHAERGQADQDGDDQDDHGQCPGPKPGAWPTPDASVIAHGGIGVR